MDIDLYLLLLAGCVASRRLWVPVFVALIKPALRRSIRAARATITVAVRRAYETWQLKRHARRQHA